MLPFAALLVGLTALSVVATHGRRALAEAARPPRMPQAGLIVLLGVGVFPFVVDVVTGLPNTREILGFRAALAASPHVEASTALSKIAAQNAMFISKM